jgi:hypothetical protein
MNLVCRVFGKLLFELLTFLVLVIVTGPSTCQAQVNSWTSPGSGHWEDSSWSLGILPAANQSVMFTNAGFKAVGIFPTTPVNFPAAMTVSNLTISAPSNSQNTLLLNFAGMAKPLNVLSNCMVGTNGRIVSLHSGLIVGGELDVSNGTFVQEAGVTAGTNGLLLVETGSAAITNATWSFGTVVMEESIFNQSGGDVAAGNLYIVDTATANLFDGLLTATNVAVGEFFPGGDLNQYGGQITSTTLDVADGNISQYGGNSSFGSVSLGVNGIPFFGNYYLFAGGLQCGSIAVGNGIYKETGGRNTVTNRVSVEGFSSPGDDYNPPTFFPSECELEDGLLTCGSVFVGDVGSFNQSNGTNSVTGDLTVSGGNYEFSGGMLSASNVVIESAGNPNQFSSFNQNGGSNQIRGMLSCAGSYTLQAGNLIAPTVVLQGSLAIASSPGATISNTVVFDFTGGTLSLNNSRQRLAQMVLSSNSAVYFVSNCQLAFAKSSGELWANGATLTVSNWNGLGSGGGADQLYFGSDKAGLTSSQLQQIQFINPAGFPPGVWFAKILPTGEIVPTAVPPVSASLTGTNLVIQWPPGIFVLQVSTNLPGPYADVPGSGPYTNSTTQFPRRFFRLRQGP